MSETKSTEIIPAGGPSPGRDIVPVRERLIAESPVAIWDRADFEQMQRVGMVLTKSGLVPETLCNGKWFEDGKEVEGRLSDETIAARCVLICNQARLWGADPLNVLQCTSLINGRLMYEGKLVNAVVQHLTGVKLRFELGRWDKDHFEAVENRSGLNGLGEALAIRVFDPMDEEREVSGSAGMWKTTRAGNPWSNPGNWPRQLRYRGSREWARAYEPGAILGILADGDEDIDFTRIEARPVGLTERLPGNSVGAGFDKDHVEAETAAAPRRRKKGVVEPEEAMHAASEPEPEAVDAEVVDGAPERPTSPEADTATAGAPDVGSEPDTSGPATDVSDDGPEASDSGPSTDEADETSPEDQGEAEDPEGLPPEFEKFIDAVEAATEWPQVKKAMSEFWATDLFKGMALEVQNRTRANVWATCKENAEAGKIKMPDHADDVTAFRLWIETVTDKDAIKGTLDVLQRSASWVAGSENLHAAIAKAVRDRLEK